jgi:hypothetical protein
MAFPINPINGQLATVNNTQYVYSLSTNSWTVVVTSVGETLGKANGAYNTANAAYAAANSATDSAVALAIALG